MDFGEFILSNYLVGKILMSISFVVQKATSLFGCEKFKKYRTVTVVDGLSQVKNIFHNVKSDLCLVYWTYIPIQVYLFIRHFCFGHYRINCIYLIYLGYNVTLDLCLVSWKYKTIKLNS